MTAPVSVPTAACALSSLANCTNAKTHLRLNSDRLNLACLCEDDLDVAFRAVLRDVCAEYSPALEVASGFAASSTMRLSTSSFGRRADASKAIPRWKTACPPRDRLEVREPEPQLDALRRARPPPA
jgi:hypothetical protein